MVTETRTAKNSTKRRENGGSEDDRNEPIAAKKDYTHAKAEKMAEIMLGYPPAVKKKN